jgi:flagellar hook assembly protein FlgD
MPRLYQLNIHFTKITRIRLAKPSLWDNPSTTIKYALPSDSKVVLEVYNIVGQKVKTLINNENKEAGYHQVNFNGTSLSSGIYLYKLTTDNFTSIKKFVLMK